MACPDKMKRNFFFHIFQNRTQVARTIYWLLSLHYPVQVLPGVTVPVKWRQIRCDAQAICTE